MMVDIGVSDKQDSESDSLQVEKEEISGLMSGGWKRCLSLFIVCRYHSWSGYYCLLFTFWIDEYFRDEYARRDWRSISLEIVIIMLQKLLIWGYFISKNRTVNLKLVLLVNDQVQISLETINANNPIDFDSHDTYYYLNTDSCVSEDEGNYICMNL